MARVLKRGEGLTLGEVREATDGFLASFVFGERSPQFMEDLRLLAEIGAAVCEGMHLSPELGLFLSSETILPHQAMIKYLEWDARLEARPE